MLKISARKSYRKRLVIVIPVNVKINWKVKKMLNRIKMYNWILELSVANLGTTVLKGMVKK